MTSNSSKWLSACWDVRRTLWGEIWEQGENTPLSLSLSGQEPDLTSKSSLDMNQHWRSRPDKAEGRETCTMFQIVAKTQGRGGTTSVSSYSQGRLMDVSDHMVALDSGRLHSQEVMSRVGSCAVMGLSSCQIKKVLDLLSLSQLHKQKN